MASKCPAPAGMIPHARTVGVSHSKVPRTCGDDPGLLMPDITDPESASHLRG